MYPDETYKRIRALDRGVAILEFLATHGRASLADLRRETGLGNATLLRILNTLQDRRWIRRAVADGAVELSLEMAQRLRTCKHAHPVAEAATPVMLKLRNSDLPYPSDLVVIRGPGVIEVLDSTRKRGPHSPNKPPLGVHPSMVLSAHGKTVLAFSDPAERKAHLTAIQTRATREERKYLEDGSLQASINETRSAGYGLRSRAYWMAQVDDVPLSGAIAFPIFKHRKLCATLSCLWLEKEKSFQDIKREGVPRLLKDCAQEISDLLSKDQSDTERAMAARLTR